MGTKIEGKGRVFAKEHDGWTSYTLGISSKKQDGTWAKAYQPIRFKKDDVPPPNATDIDYVAFPVVKESKFASDADRLVNVVMGCPISEEDKRKLAVIIRRGAKNEILWQILSSSVVNEMPTEFAEPANFTAIETGDIPF